MIADNKKQNTNEEINHQNQLDPQQDVQVQEKKTRKKIQQYRFKEEMLLDQNKGLKRLYDKFQRTAFSATDETKDLDRLITIYKEWHELVMPKYDFNYFIDRVQFFGAKPMMKSTIRQIRQIHLGKLSWDIIKPVIQEDVQVPNADVEIDNMEEQEMIFD